MSRVRLSIGAVVASALLGLTGCTTASIAFPSLPDHVVETVPRTVPPKANKQTTPVTLNALNALVAKLPQTPFYTPEPLRFQTVIGRGDTVCTAPIVISEQTQSGVTVYWDGDCDRGQASGEGRLLVRGSNTELDVFLNASITPSLTDVYFALMDFKGLRLGTGYLEIKESKVVSRLTDTHRLNQPLGYFVERVWEGPLWVRSLYEAVHDATFTQFCNDQYCGQHNHHLIDEGDFIWFTGYRFTKVKPSDVATLLSPKVHFTHLGRRFATWDGKTEIAIDQDARDALFDEGYQIQLALEDRLNDLVEGNRIAFRAFEKLKTENASPFADLSNASYFKASLKWMRAFKDTAKRETVKRGGLEPRF